MGLVWIIFAMFGDAVWENSAWASYQMHKIAGCACAGNAPLVSDPDMHHGTCVTHVPWCMPGSLTSGFLWSRWRGKRFRHSRRMRIPYFTYLVRGPYHKIIHFHRITSSYTLEYHVSQISILTPSAFWYLAITGRVADTNWILHNVLIFMFSW